MSEIKEKPQGQEVKQPQEGVDFNSFDFADVCFECNRCGHIDVLDKGIEDGLQFVLPATDKHEWRMVCGNCKNTMRIYFKHSGEDIIEQRKAEKAKKLAEEKALQKAKDKENESKKKNKKKEPSKGSNKDTKGSVGTDPEGTGSVTSNDENTK